MTTKRHYGWKRQAPDPRDLALKFTAMRVANLPAQVSLAANMSQPDDQGSLGSCHDDKTDVLTEDGWMRFADLTGDEKLASVDPATSTLHFETPKKLVRYHYDGDMHYGSHRFLDYAVTPDHKMLVRKWNERARTLTDEFSLVPASEMGWYCGLMASVKYAGTRPQDTVTIKGVQHKRKKYQQDMVLSMSTWLKFLGIYLAEGTLVRKRTKYATRVGAIARSSKIDYEDKGKWKHVVQIAASKEREKMFIRSVLMEIGVHFHEQADRFQFCEKRIYKALESLGYRGIKAPQKFVPEFVFQQSAENIAHLLHGHAMGDGHEQNGNTSHYTSSSRLCDDLQRLVFLAGRQGYVKVRQPHSRGTIRGRSVHGKHPEHRISSHKSSLLSIDKKADVRIERYIGEVFCAEMKTHHTLVTRRNGRILISGNCGPNTVDEMLKFDMKCQGLPVVDTSRLFTYWNARGGTATDSGVDNRAMLKSLHRTGVCDETLWPYDITKFADKPPQAAFDAAKARLIQSYHAVSVNLQAMKACLACGHPFIFGFEVFGQMESDECARTGIVTDPSPGNTPVGGHDVLCFGYSDAEQRFYMTNHWGADWGCVIGGIRGCFKISYDYAANPGYASDFWTINAAP